MTCHFSAPALHRADAVLVTVILAVLQLLQETGRSSHMGVQLRGGQGIARTHTLGPGKEEGEAQGCRSHAFSVTGLARYAPMLEGMQSQPKADAWVPAIRRQTHKQLLKKPSGRVSQCKRCHRRFAPIARLGCMGPRRQMLLYALILLRKRA